MDAVAERTDAQTGVRERAEFVGVDGDQVYVVHHTPPGIPRGDVAVVICSPFFAEFARNYRREVIVARRLAAAGFPVTRFHHRGQGNSTGDPAMLDLPRLVVDARRVADVAREVSGVGRIVLHGTRLAAFTAAGAAEDGAVSLWEPVTSGTRYFNEVFRTRMVQAVHDEEQLKASDLRAVLEAGASVDVLGHSVHPQLYLSLHDATLDEVMGSAIRDLLVVQFGRTGELRKEYRALMERAHHQEIHASSTTTSESESWWIANRRADYFVAEERRDLTTELIDAMADWIEQLGSRQA